MLIGSGHINQPPRIRERRDVACQHLLKQRVIRRGPRKPQAGEQTCQRSHTRQRASCEPTRAFVKRGGPRSGCTVKRFDMRAQHGRRVEIRRMRAHLRTQNIAFGLRRRARMTACQMLGDLSSGRGIELVVDIRIEHLPYMRAIHELIICRDAAMRCCKSSRPRARRDITVPMGTATIALISL